MTHDAAVDTKMKYLSEDHNLILIADNKKQAVILQNLKNYGGTKLQSTNKVEALFRINPNTQVVVLNVDAAISTQSKRIQSVANIITAATISTDSLCALQAPTRGDVNYNGLSMFTPAPFLQNAILEAMSPCPFKIIQAAIAAHTLYIHKLKNNKGFSARDIKAHHNLLIMWCLAVGQESIPETRFSLLPEDDKLKKHKANTHHEHIQLTLEATAAQPESIQPKQCKSSGNSEPTWHVHAKHWKHKPRPNKSI
jgi:hypothetical protein